MATTTKGISRDVPTPSTTGPTANPPKNAPNAANASNAANAVKQPQRQTSSGLSFTKEMFTYGTFLFFLTLLLRIYRIQEPNQVVFDEFHTITFASRIHLHQFEFDTYPPLSKMLYATMNLGTDPDHAVNSIMNAQAAKQQMEQMSEEDREKQKKKVELINHMGVLLPTNAGDVYPEWYSVKKMRMVNVMEGCVSVVLMFGIARLLGISRNGSLLAASFLIFDPMHAILSRIAVATDLLVVVMFQASFFLILLLCREVRHAQALESNAAATTAARSGTKQGAPSSSAPSMTTKMDQGIIIRKYVFMTLISIVGALALASRWIAYSGAFMLVVVMCFGVWPLVYKPMRAYELLYVLFVMVATYTMVFFVFFSLSYCNGKGNGFMSQDLRSAFVACDKEYGLAPVYHSVKEGTCPLNLEGEEPSECHAQLSQVHRNDPLPRFHMFSPVWLLKASWEYNKQMFLYSIATEPGKHPADTPWYQWIADWRGVSMFRTSNSVSPSGEQLFQRIYAVFNPAVIYISTFFNLVFVVMVVVLTRYRKVFDQAILNSFIPRMSMGAFLIACWVITLSPYLVIYKTGPLTHYMSAFLFAELLCCVTLDLVPGKGRYIVMLVVFLAVVGTYVFLSPWVYFLPMTARQHSIREILPGWK